MAMVFRMEECNFHIWVYTESGGPRESKDKFPDRSEWKDGFQTNMSRGLIWYADSSKTRALGLGCMVMAQGRSLVSVLGNAPQYSR
jgi:hypothetical protein